MVGRDETARAYQPISSYGVIGDCGITVAQICRHTWTSVVRAALIQSGVPSVPATFQGVIGSGHVRESMQAGTCSFGPAIAPPPSVQAHPPAGLACFSGVSLHRLLPHDL